MSRSGLSIDYSASIHTCGLPHVLCTCSQCLSQDLETGCLKLTVVKSSKLLRPKGDHNILIFQPLTCINSSKYGMISLNNMTGIIRR